MKIVELVFLGLLVLMSLAAGVAKLLTLPQERAFFRPSVHLPR